MTLTVSIEPLRYFTEIIAGDKFQVISMVPEGSNPETYDPTPQQLVTLNKSCAFLRIGYIGFEQAWAEKLQSNAPEVKFFDMSEGIELIREDEVHHGNHSHSGGVEPHVWNSTQNAYIIAENIFHTLCKLDSANISYYKENLSKTRIRDRTHRPRNPGLLTEYNMCFSYLPSCTFIFCTRLRVRANQHRRRRKRTFTRTFTSTYPTV